MVDLPADLVRIAAVLLTALAAGEAAFLTRWYRRMMASGQSRRVLASGLMRTWSMVGLMAVLAYAMTTRFTTPLTIQAVLGTTFSLACWLSLLVQHRAIGRE